MAKRAHKKQKTSKEGTQPLGTNVSTDDVNKDDEERRLESILFGTKFDSTEADKFVTFVGDKSRGGKELNNLGDEDLFFIDDGIAAAQDLSASLDGNDEDDHDEDEDDTEDSESNTSGSDTESPSSTTRLEPPNPHIQHRKKPAWTDPSDPPLVSLSAPRLRKLRDAPTESSLSGPEYEARLRRQYERINPEPLWAAKARKSRIIDETNDIHDSGGIDDLLSSTSGILASTQRGKGTNVMLPAGTLAIERLRDANQAVQRSGSGAIRAVAFHPSDKVPVLCVGTADRRIRLFNIDGHTSPLLQTLHIPSLPITSQNSVNFHPLGSSLLLTGPRPFFYTHDLQTGVTSKHVRGLWGTTFSSVNDGIRGTRKRGRARAGTGEADTTHGGGGEGMETTAFSPLTGDVLAVGGRNGYVHLVDWKSGAGQVVGSLKCSGSGGGVRALWWVPDLGSPTSILGDGMGGGGRQHLAVLSGDAEVYLWDVGERRCVRRWKDEGGFRGAGRAMAGTAVGGNGGWLAIGSNTGFVNVYGSDSFAPPSSTTFASDFNNTPKPAKSIANLTTAISTIKFNHDAQLMAIASQEKKDAMRLIHLPSLTSFANWPTSSTPLGHVTAVDFSAQSEYLAIGNSRGRVLLYHLKDHGVR